MPASRAVLFGLLLEAVGLVAGVRLRATKQLALKPYRQPLQNFQNTQYFADITIGGQELKGIFDTGSFEVLVRSTQCKDCQHPTPPYNGNISKSFEPNGTLMKHVFGSGPCITRQGYETISVGPMKASKQSFWEIIQHRIPVLNSAKFAAIVGIGPQPSHGSGDKTLLMSYGVDEFSVCLQRGSGADGFLTWGPVAGADSVATVPVIGDLHWAADMTSVKMVAPGKDLSLLAGGRHESICGGKGCAAIVDSGTSLIAAPSTALAALSDMVGPIEEDCSNLHKLPYLSFTLGGKHFELPPRAYVMRVSGAVAKKTSLLDILYFKPKAKPKTKKVNICVPAFMKLDMMSQHGPVWILGMPFFRYYHTSFNRKERTMSFATAGKDCEPQPYGNSTILLDTSARRGDDFEPTDIDVDALVPPTLSSQLDDGGAGRPVEI